MMYRLNLIVDGRTLVDEVGVERVDIEAACLQTISEARSIIAAEAKNNRAPPDWSIEITDWSGTHLASIAFADVSTLH